MPSASPTQQLGVPGTPILGGVVSRREKNPALIGAMFWKTVEDMLRNRIEVASSTRFLLGLGGRVDWKWNPANDSAPARKVAEFFTDITVGSRKKKRAWRRSARALMLHAWKGFALGELTAVPMAEGYGVKVLPLDQHTIARWLRNPVTKEIIGVVQRDVESGREIPIPRWKLVYTVDDVLTSSPEGIGLLRQAVAATHQITRYEQIEGTVLETDIRGIPYLAAPIAEMRAAKAKRLKLDASQVTLSAGDPELETLVAFMNNHVRGADSGLLLDSAVYTDNDGKPTNVRKWSAELLRGDGGPLPHLNTAIDRIQYSLATLFGTQVLFAGKNGKGSLALSKQQAELAILLVETMLEDVKDAAENDLVPFIGQMNNIPEELWPSPETSSLEQRDVEVIAATLRDMELANLPPGDKAHDEVRAAMGISPRPEVDPAELERDAGLRGRGPAPEDDPDDVDPDDADPQED